MDVAVEKMDTSSPPGTPVKDLVMNHSIDKGSHSDDNSSNESHHSSKSEDCNKTEHTGVENTIGPTLKHNTDVLNPNTNDSNHTDENDNKNKDNSINDDTNSHGPVTNCSNSQDSVDSQNKPKSAINGNASKTEVSAVGSECGTATNDEGEEDEEDGTEEDGSENGSKTKEAVSVNSDSDPETVDDDSSGDSQTDSDDGDVVMIDQPKDEVHEIVSDDDDDDCVVTTENNAEKVKSNGDLNEESDIEESLEDPLNQNDRKITKAIDSKETTTVVQDNAEKKEAGGTVVIVDTDSILSGKVPQTGAKAVPGPPKSTQTLYDTITARGTTVTPVSVKSSQSTSTQAQMAPLLPSLTDDMFVVEAPSFIVPYVYEKPSVKPFREFVDVLGKELEDQRAKEEQDRLEKEKEEKEKRRKEREARGEEPYDSEEEAKKAEKKEEKPEETKTPEEEEGVKTKKEDKKKGKKRKKNDDDDASWDGESGSESEEEEAISEDDELTTVVIKAKDDDLEEIIKPITSELNADITKTSVKVDSFFENNLGKFFINIGVNLVQEYVQTDLLKQQKRKLRKELKSNKPITKPIETAIACLLKNVEYSRNNNASLKFRQKECKFCGFLTESALAMSHHMETPHMKNNIYTCNFCPFEVRSPHDILFHMEAEHNTRGRLERAPAYHQCANCPFEDNGKGKLARHLIACAKKFKPDLNLCPPTDWEPPAKIPKITRPRNIVTPYNRVNPLGRPPTISGTMPLLGRPRGPTPMMGNNTITSRGGVMITGAPMVRGGMMVRNSSPLQMPTTFGQNMPGKLTHQPSISITPLPRTPQLPPPPPKIQGSFVICEICDGYIKDLEQLRSHMQFIHKVKIHPKMMQNRPPLNCQKCQFRFFTDQGLERHLLGSHGLVTSSMQETANKGKDAGRCPVCGRVYQWKLLNHVAKDHNLTLKPAHLSYKCTVCSATFGMYKQFENHVYSEHGAVGKRLVDNKAPKK